MPDITSLYYALGVANRFGRRHGYKLNSTIPIQPCLVYPDPNLFRYVSENYCSVGTETGSYVIDPSGRVRPCSLSSTILGDFRTHSMAQILNNSILERYVEPCPAMCTECGYLTRCRGGCRAAAESCYGSPAAQDPFLRITLSTIRQREMFPQELK
jgi:radical SAM protein with 4Fe4S-binding SPASM domain